MDNDELKDFQNAGIEWLGAKKYMSTNDVIGPSGREPYPDLSQIVQPTMLPNAEKVKFMQLLLQSKQKIVEQSDYIQQLSAQPKIYGIALAVFPEEFKLDDFKRGEQVRVVYGQNAGLVGSVKDVDKTSVTIDFGRTRKDMKVTIVRKVRNPDLIVLPDTQNERTVEDPHPSLYRTGSYIMIGGERCQIVSEPGDTGKLEFLNPWGETTELNVGVADFIAPIGKQAGCVYVLAAGQIIECNLPREQMVKVGDSVTLNAQTLQIMRVGGLKTFGMTATFKKRIDMMTSEVEFQDAVRVVYVAVTDDLKTGDRVAMDASHQAIVQKLESEKVVASSHDTGVSWHDIGGQDDAKQEIIDAIEGPIVNKEQYEFYNTKAHKGLLLYGPPGNGKTMFGKAMATSLAALHGRESVSTGFIYVKGTEILHGLVGASESKIRGLFLAAKEHKAEFGYPAVVFIDEADSVLSKRGTGISSDMEKTIVPTFLTEMDGLEESAAIVVLATNRPDVLDPAVTRPGRITAKVYVHYLDQMGAKSVYELYLKNVPLCGESGTIEDFAKKLTTATFNTKGLAEQVSGALIADVVNLSTQAAMKRDISNKEVTGLRLEDVLQVLERMEGNAEREATASRIWR